MRSAAFHTLGCKVNIYETEAMQKLMRKAGYEILDFSQKSDIYIINTCSVTNVADKKSRQLLHKAKAENPDAIIVAVGCYVQSAADKLKEDNKIDIIVGNNMKKDIVSIIDKYYEENAVEEKDRYIIDINKTNEYEELSVSEIAKHTRAFIKVQDGCNQFCSYCIIPYTRGRVRSRRADDILNEVSELAKNGFREIVLTGIHLSSYGTDLKEETDSLLKLIKLLAGVEGIDRIRIGSLEPRIITEEFLGGIKEVKQFCPHFHLSLQSGCDKTLKNMNRQYTSAEFKQGVDLIRRYYESPAITTDVIVGFPGESESDFEESKNFVKNIGFYEMHIFPYSVREGTKAAKMPDKLTQKEKAKRAKDLANVNKLMSDEFRKLRIGKEEEILIEEELTFEGKSFAVGHTKEYVRIAVPIEGDISIYNNRLARGEVERLLTEDILLMPIFELDR